MDHRSNTQSAKKPSGMTWHAKLTTVLAIGGFVITVVMFRHDVQKGVQWIVRVVPNATANVSEKGRALVQRLSQNFTARSTQEAAEQDLQVAVSALQAQTGHVAVQMDEEEYHDALRGDDGWWYAAEVMGLTPPNAEEH
ncbi:hypothetical protein CBER1_02180 [Cercospora berteroae]|uniref:Uncharacterized protein n=1 Tax=Cercospora berteroae TaxID=357750 RepID=A0A2S6BQC8_9PEZI|nr:hypothetical protein CBER1_02180 [Cercospora berteroae]